MLEAYPYAFQPHAIELRRLLQTGAIGAVRSVQSFFGFTVPNPQTNIRMQPALGGGALLDAGSYALSIIRLAMGCAPQRVRADATWADSGSGFRFAAEAFAAMVAARDQAAFEAAAQVSLDNAATLAALARSARTGASVTL